MVNENESDSKISSFKSSPVENPDVIYGHRFCQSSDSKWLCLENIYQKFHRSNIYDIGGTYYLDSPDFWFTYKTEQIGNIFLLHLFVSNPTDGYYTLELSHSNEVIVNKKIHDAIYLTEHVTKFSFTAKDKLQNYLTTYSFTDLDIDLMEGRKLYISVRIPIRTECPEVTDKIVSYQDFTHLLNDPVSADFVVESEDGMKFKVHKTILATRSDVFKAMLNFDSAESQNNHVKLLDAAGDEVYAMLEFLYGGAITNIKNLNFAMVLMLADRYNLKGLHELCNHALKQQLNIDNALDILTIADMYGTGSDTLKYEAFKFIKKNRQTLDTTTFNEIKNVQLLKELCQYMSV